MEFSTEELMKKSAGELVDMGICPTCFDRKNGGKYYGDQTLTRVYQDKDIECLFVSNPRAPGHMMISPMTHYHDMGEAPDELNYKIIKFSKRLMNIIKEVYGCERVYFCTMSDGPMNHYHVQLIPRYSYEERGSKNFVKPRHDYIYDEEKFNKVKAMVNKIN